MCILVIMCMLVRAGDCVKVEKGEVKFNPEAKHRELLENVIQFGLNQSQFLIEVQEPDLYNKGVRLNKTAPAHFLSVFNKQQRKSKMMSKFAYATLQASNLLSRQFQLTRQQVLYGLERVELRTTSIFDECPIKSRQVRQLEACSGFSAMYRTPDGSCNNLDNPSWGSAFMPFLRFLPPDYSDGISSVRRSLSNGPLPNPRLLSSSIHSDESHDTSHFTMMVMQWGQFIDHDITSTPTTRGFRESVLKCCSDDGKPLDSHLLHPDCMSIDIPIDDKFYSKYNVTCMDFVRSSPAPRRDCSLGPRDQINQITSYMDGSNLYGSTAEDQHNLRLMTKGKLKYTDLHIRKPLLPPLSPEDSEEECRVRTANLHCFQAGDNRVNEQPGLATMHTLWLREHNRIALKLSKINKHWSDDRVYLEARRLVGAMMQHITYNEWLPVVLGSRVLEIFELKLVSSGYYDGYNSSVNPTIANSFAAAAFRFGHSLVRGSIARCNKEFRQVPFDISLHSEMNNPSNLHNFGSVDRILLGLASQKLSRRDEFITEELTNHLFQTPRSHHGMDLAAINIQRGRDHGLAPYNIWREQCGLKRFTKWEELEAVMDKRTVSRIENVYEHVDDIDLFTGGMSEKPVVGGLVGPTFACIIGQQFLNLRQGDRFWYENGPDKHPGAFTPGQLAEIRTSSLARVICDCMDDVENLQPFIFLQPDQFVNIRTRCRGEDIPHISLSKWREDPNLHPQQFSSQSLYDSQLVKMSEQNFSSESPSRPGWPVQWEGDGNKLQFVSEEEVKEVLRKPPSLGLEPHITYSQEIPTPLTPQQYFNLSWALEQGRQQLEREGEPTYRSNKSDITDLF